MSLLDDLKKEASQVKEQESDAQDKTQAKLASVEEALHPRMQDLFTYFKQLKEQLEVVKPDLNGVYELQGAGKLGGLKQGDYRLFTDDVPQRVRKFTFQYYFMREAPMEIRSKNKPTTQKFKEYLWQNSLKFTVKESGDGAGTFSLEPKIPVTFEFQANIEKEAVQLRVRNFGFIGVSNYFLGPEKVTSELMEEIAKMVLHKPNEFDSMMGGDISDDDRTRIREMLQKEKQARAAEVGETIPDPSHDDDAGVKKGLGKRLGGLFGKK